MRKSAGAVEGVTTYAQESDPGDLAPARFEPREVAHFVADMTSELTRMAKDARFELLAQFLTMARIEAEMLARRYGKS